MLARGDERTARVGRGPARRASSSARIPSRAGRSTRVSSSGPRIV